MGFSKLRPVGSPVPLPKAQSDGFVTPWAEHYDSVFVNSGTAALSLAVKLSVKRRRVSQSPEVILPAYGCPDLIAAVVAQGAKPVLIDLEEARPWMDLEAVENAVTRNTVAIIAVGFLGIPERLYALKHIADAQGVALIEDSAQVFPPCSSDNGLADYSVLSFGRGKPINMMGGGALLVRKDLAGQSAGALAAIPEVEVTGGAAWRLKRWVFNLLLTRLLYGAMERIPFLGIGQTVFHPLTVIERHSPVEGLLEAGIEEFASRKDNGALYSEMLQELTSKGWVNLAQECFDEKALKALLPENPISLRYPLLAPCGMSRNKAVQDLNRRGIGASVFYGQALPAISGVGEFIDNAASTFPHACDFAQRLVTLPTHSGVYSSDINSVARALLEQY